MTGNKLMIHLCIASVLTLNAISRSAAEADETELQTLNSSACLTTPDSRLILNCVAGQMVRLLRVFLGHSTTGTCEYSNDDCTMDLPSTDSYECVGTDSCQISVPSVNRGKMIPKCRKPSSYIQALYQCIPESSSVNVCDDGRGVLVQQHGFLRTPGYPNNYPNGMDCNFSVRAPHEDQRLKLFVIDLNLEPHGTACSDWVQVFDGFQSITLCGQRTRYWLRSSTQRSFFIRFYSDGKSTERGFWLYYEAFPLVTTASTTKVSTWTISPEATARTGFGSPLPFHFTDADSKSASASFSASSSSSYSSSEEAYFFSASSSHPPTASAAASNQVVYLTTDTTTTQPHGVLMLIIVITLLISILLVPLIVVFVKSLSRRSSLSNGNSPTEDTEERLDNLEKERKALYAPSPRSSSSSSSFRGSSHGHGGRTTCASLLRSNSLSQRNHPLSSQVPFIDVEGGSSFKDAFDDITTDKLT